jgi:hypothetical protein
MLRVKTTTQCRSRNELGGAKAQRRTASMTFLMLDRALELFSGIRFRTLFAGRLEAQAHCLRSGGLVP